MVVYHRDARATEPVLDNVGEVRAFLHFRTPFAWLVVAGAAAALALTALRGSWTAALLWAWPAVAVAFVLVHEPLHENHLLVLPVALALAAGTALGSAADALGRLRIPALAALALALAAGYVQQHRRVIDDQVEEGPGLVWAAQEVRRATDVTDLVVSDHSIVPYLADRRAPGALVDTAFLRFATGSLTPERVLATVDEADVAAVVAGRAFIRQPRILAGLRQRFDHRVERHGITVYMRRRVAQGDG
jgi:hypothetical protein